MTAAQRLDALRRAWLAEHCTSPSEPHIAGPRVYCALRDEGLITLERGTRLTPAGRAELLRLGYEDTELLEHGRL